MKSNSQVDLRPRSGGGLDGQDGLDGDDGLSAYEVAVNNGFSGTEQEWLLSLEGADSIVPGPEGPAGADSIVPGPEGPAGADSIVPGPAGADSIVPGPEGPAGADSIVPGPAGADSIVPGPEGPAGSDATVTKEAVEAVLTGEVSSHTHPDSGGTSGYSYFPIWAEENADLGSNSFEWAFGNGANCPVNQGVIIGIACECISLHISVRGNSTVEVSFLKNGVIQAETVSTSASQMASHTLVTPIAFAVGDYVNFKTIVGDAASNGGLVTAWFRVEI